MIKRFGSFFVALTVLVGGCAVTPEAPPQAIRYNCDGGKSFRLTVARSGEAARIEFNRMEFSLVAASATEKWGDRFTCDVLTVTRSGPNAENASVEMEGEVAFRGCVRVP